MYLSNYQTAGFDTDCSDAGRAAPAQLHADMVRRLDAPKLLRFGGRANLKKSDIRRLPQCDAPPSRTLARLKASLTSPGARLFITTSSTTFIFMLGFLS